MDTFKAEIPNNFRLPRRIHRLGELAYNLWWTWNPDAQRLFIEIDRALWERTNHNPTRFLSMVQRAQLNAVTQNHYYLKTYDRIFEEYDNYMNTDDTWCSRKYPEYNNRPIAYFSTEFGLHETLPIYAGGLGILSGDHLKGASDLGLPLVAIGFLYTHGYFSQHITEDGWQEAHYLRLKFSDLPIIPIVGTDDQTVQRIWQETSTTGTTLWHEQSLDDGETWIRTVPVSVFGDTIGTPSLSRDSAGRLHLLLVVRSGTNKFVLQHWLYDGQRWSAERTLDINFYSNTAIISVEGNVSDIGNLGVLLSDLILSTDNSSQEYEIVFANRLLEIPDTIVTPDQQLTAQPQITPTIAGEIQPTKTQSPVAATPTGTPIVFPDEPEPSNSSNWIAIAGPIVIGLIILIVIYIIFRGIRSWR